jgi:FkbM family methyltransferase
VFLYRFKQLIRDAFLYFGNPFNLFSFSPQHKKLIELGPYDSVFHIGADIGQELSLYKFMGVKRIVWVEPNKKSILKLKLRTFLYPRIKHEFINSLISDTTGQLVVFYEYNRSGASSVFKPTQEFLNSNKKRFISKTVTYISSTISDALGQKISFEDRNNLLVIDTQCSEFKILKSFLVKKNYRFVERLSNYNIKHLPEFGDYLFKYAN